MYLRNNIYLFINFKNYVNINTIIHYVYFKIVNGLMKISSRIKSCTLTEKKYINIYIRVCMCLNK